MSNDRKGTRGGIIHILLFQRSLAFMTGQCQWCCLNSICLTPFCAGWMCQLCAVDRAMEPHPPLHLWNGGLPAYLHVHQQRLEGRGEHGGIYSSLRGICSKNPPAAGLESVVLLNISRLQTGTLVCLWFPHGPQWRFSNLFLRVLSLCRITCLGWFLVLWIQGKENVPMIPSRKMLPFWSVRYLINFTIY